MLLTQKQADSEEKSKVSVALGYLAVIIGYLCLDQQVRSLIGERTEGSGLGQLIESIREFITLYKSVDSKVHELESLVSELRRHRK